jgi:Holliday junction resolvase
MKESDLIEKIKRYLRGVDGLFFWKEHGGGFGSSGIPDLIVCYRGRFIAFEVKAEKGKTTVLQEVSIRKIIKAGGYASVVRSMEEVKAVIGSLKG